MFEEHQDRATQIFLSRNSRLRTGHQAKPCRCRLDASAIDPGLFVGTLPLVNRGVPKSLFGKDADCLRIHFELERGGVQ